MVQYLDADFTVLERTSGLVKGNGSSAKKSKEYIARAKKEIEKFDEAWGKGEIPMDGFHALSSCLVVPQGRVTNYE